MKLKAFIFFFLIPFVGMTQSILTGVVLDNTTQEPLPFVKVSVDGSTRAVHTNIDGEFKLRTSEASPKVRFSYVGYKDKVVNADPSKRLVVYLAKSSVELSEVTILPGVNPAEVIMERVIERKKENDHEQQDYVSIAYHKFYFVPKTDSTYLNDTAKYNSLDSSRQKAIELFETQYIMLIESISRRQHKAPGLTNEKVLSSKVSGMKNPMFSALSAQIQSFSFYEDNFAVLGTVYESPLKKGAIKRYLFILEDSTLTPDGEKIYTISFRPRKNASFKGMEGVLYINSEDYALTNVIATPEGDDLFIGLRIRQRYEKVEGTWFPMELNTRMESPIDDVFSLLGQSTTYIREVSMDTSFRSRDFDHIALEIDDESNDTEEEKWDEMRGRELDSVEAKTYRVVDSLGKELNIDRRLKYVEVLATGRLPLFKYFELELDKILAFNDYEGFRLGAGIRTGRKISKHFSVGGYGAYGFKDQTLKYGGDLEVIFDKRSDLIMDARWLNDVVENGGVNYFHRSNSFESPEAYREFFINRMDREERREVGMSFRTLKYFLWRVSGTSRFLKNTTDYVFLPFGSCSTCDPQAQFVPVLNEYWLTETSLEVRWSHGERWTMLSSTKASTGTPYPVVHAKWTRGWDGLLDGEFDYDRLTVDISHDLNFGRWGSPELFFSAGQLFGGPAPLNLNFNTPAAFVQWSVVVPNAFETMRINEFYSDRFIAGTLNYDIGGFTIRKDKSEPGFILSGKALWGDMNNRTSHQNLEFDVPVLGYYEAGLVVTNVLISQFTGLGIGAFYRLGNYSLPGVMDNFAFKLDARFSF